MQFLFWKIFLSGLLFLSAATNILKKPQNKSHLATLVVWQHLSYTNSCEILKFVHYNNQTSWVQSCDWWAGRQLAVGAKAGYQRPVDGQVDGGVVKQDAGAIIRVTVSRSCFYFYLQNSYFLLAPHTNVNFPTTFLIYLSSKAWYCAESADFDKLLAHLTISEFSDKLL